MSNSTSTAMPVLEGAREALTHEGWTARLVRHGFRGDVDVRLHVCGPQPWLEAELLGPHDDIPVGDWWAAVRVEAGDGVVWSGPPRSSGSADVTQFVLDLLRASCAELEARYRRLG